MLLIVTDMYMTHGGSMIPGVLGTSGLFASTPVQLSNQLQLIKECLNLGVITDLAC